MIFYASGAIVDHRTLEMVVERRIAVLTSFAYKGAMKKHFPILAPMLRAARFRLPYMVDSGAFTAWSKGKEVRREALIDFYNRTQDEYGDAFDFTFVSLDRIPGRQGMERTAEDYRVAADDTVRNYEAMRREVRGYVKPVYHNGDPERVLRAYDDAPYISLSASQDMAYAEREAWVSETAASMSTRQLHGLAMTGTRMLRTARWHSVDSASWVLWAGMGAIALLRPTGALKLLACSAESPRNKHFEQHLSTLSPIARDRVIADLEAEGITEEEVRTNSITRARYNIWTFKRACDWAATQPVVTARRTEGLFDA